MVARSIVRRRVLWIAGVGILALLLGGCARDATHESGAVGTPDYDHAPVENGNATYRATQERVYDGVWAAKAHVNANPAAGSAARGVFDVNVPAGYDGYYGAALYFPAGTFSGSTPKQQKRIDIMRWFDSATQNYGGIRINADHLARLVRGKPGSAADIGAPFKLREGCWNWVFVHQKLSNSASSPASPNSDVYLNGKKIVSSTGPTNYDGGGASTMSFGIADMETTGQTTALDFYVDNAHVGATNDSIVEPRANACGPAPPYEFGDTVQPLGADEVVYDWDWGYGPAGPQLNSCEADHYPDEPTRAFRNSSGLVTVPLESSPSHRRMIGTNLNNVKPEQQQTALGGRACGQNNTHQDGFNNDPGKFHYREWLNSTYSFPATNAVYGLVHGEWRGNESPQLCPGGSLDTCLYGGVSQWVSQDGGATYQDAGTPPSNLVAAQPYKYEAGTAQNPWGIHLWNIASNIVHRAEGTEDFFYFLIPPWNNPSAMNGNQPNAQKEGTCLVRTSDIASPGSWRAWGDNGDAGTVNDFEVKFQNPYDPAYNPATDPPINHVCEPLPSLPQTHFTPDSLTYSEYFDKYMLVGTQFKAPTGVYYALSDDLKNWSDLKLLMKANIMATFGQLNGCQGERPIGYPSVLDPTDSSANFEHPGVTPYLYFTRFNDDNGSAGGCQPKNDRDLVRLPIRFEKPRLATLEEGQAFDPDTGFDGGTGNLTVESGPGYPSSAYDGTKRLQTVYYPTASPSMGHFDVNWPNGSDVWYGAGFYLQNQFPATNDNVALMRWQSGSAASGPHGGITLKQSDDKYHLVVGNTADQSQDTNLGPAFTLPENRWFWLEVHQRLSQTKPLNEVFVDGKIVATSASSNTYADSAGVPDRVRFGAGAQGQSNLSLVYLDRASISVSERGP